jgi:hypothetical protein
LYFQTTPRDPSYRMIVEPPGIVDPTEISKLWVAVDKGEPLVLLDRLVAPGHRERVVHLRIDHLESGASVRAVQVLLGGFGYPLRNFNSRSLASTSGRSNTPSGSQSVALTRPTSLREARPGAGSGDSRRRPGVARPRRIL